jgi:class 3 adenylate cyclase
MSHQHRSTAAPERDDVVAVPRADAPFLAYREDSGPERLYELEPDRAVTIGRSAEVDVRIDWDPSVSSLHAEVVRIGDAWLVSDEGMSRNGTFVNNQRVGARRRLRDNDVIRVGHTALTFNDPGSQQRSRTTLIDGLGSVGTATLLFTDLVGSTELMARLGDDAADRLRRDHFALLRDVAGGHGGEEVKSLGDGLMVAFASAVNAVTCAIRMQQRVAAYNRELGDEAIGVRIGLNAGEVVNAEDDYFGTPVVVAKRLCDRGASGQILMSDLVRALVGSRGGHEFVALGALELKGLTDEVVAFELDWRESG